MKLDRSKLSYSAVLAIASTSSLGLMGVAPALAADVTRVLPPPPTPLSTVSGYVELYGLIGRFSQGGGSEDFQGFGGAGRLNWWFSPNWALQLDAYGESKQSGASDTTFGIAGHLAMRDPRVYALGLMASTGTQDSAPWSTLALEGQYYLGNLTLYGQVGATHATSFGLGTDWYAFLQGRYFVNPNFALLADATFSKLNSSKLPDVQQVKVGIQAEFRPAQLPLSLFARLQHARSTNTSGPDASETTAYAGIKLYAAQPTLLSNDRTGATFLDANPIYGAFNTKLAASAP